ncbi:uncharacterized protein LOC123871186 isoform X2 [Maniola jurtina]|uniref:uncharacterized protein LOC123871186 isoform X2 n=1 Tax=Maniola jurtina TaxID=191418 RepID=UPI001E6877EE|nr:uncharacterized protein LOC123871186 isoform X2 [Maniola jurtina]
MRSCSVPGCDSRTALHSVPYTNKVRWKHWLKLCPFFFKYGFRQLEYVKICRKHFIPEHVDHVKERLKKDAFPLLHLPGLETNTTINKESKVLEINPIESNELVNFKVVAPTSLYAETDTTLKCPSTEGIGEKRRVTDLVYLKAEDTQDNEHSLKENDSQYITLDDDGFQDNEYVLPSATVANQSAHTDSQEQSTINCPSLLSRSHLEKNLYPNNHSILSYDHVHTKSSPTKKVTPAEPNKQSDVCIHSTVTETTASALGPLQRKPAQTRTLESLVTELKELFTAEEMAEFQPSSAVLAADTPASVSKPMFDTAPCPPTQGPLVKQHLPLASNTEIKRVRLDKENSTPNEQMLRKQNNILKAKLKAVNLRCKRLQSKLDGILAIAKPYLKAYPNLTRQTKALIDTQVRLAGVKCKASRYTEEDKLFALRLHQISPDCYRFLQQYLKLPTKSTMKAIVKNA